MLPVGLAFLAGGTVILMAQFLEMGANLVGHPEGVEVRVGAEEAAVPICGGSGTKSHWIACSLGCCAAVHAQVAVLEQVGNISS